MRALADTVGVPVHTSAVPETAAQGAAFMARLGLGLEQSLTDAARWVRTGEVIEPDPVAQAAASERYQSFLDKAAPGAHP
jgi:xylulokinase